MSRGQAVHSACMVILTCTLGLLPAGCQYRVGSVGHPQLESLAVGSVVNHTAEASFTPLLRGYLAEELMRDGSVAVTDAASADALIDAEITRFRSRRLARAEVREARAREKDREAYQTVIYRAEVVVRYRVLVPGRTTPLLADAEVTGTADLSRFPDMDVPRQVAFGQALHDAARQIAASITEAW